MAGDGIRMTSLVQRASAGATQLREQTHAIVADAVRSSEAPGIVAAVIRPRLDPEPLTVAVGWADREAGRPVSADTMFMAGSIAKLFTATLVMQLVDEGAIELDGFVNDHLSESRRIRDRRGQPAPVTFRQVLTHTSGLPPSWAGTAARPDSPGEMEAFLEGGFTVHHPPGERTIYANAGFVVLGDLMARRANQRWPDYARARLLEPLRMNKSTFASPWTLEENGREDLAAPYGDMFGGRERSEYVDVSAIAPASGLISSARELSHFVRMILDEGHFEGHTILTARSVRAMTSLQRRANPQLDEGFGFGFGVREDRGRRVIWWDGALPGAAVRLAMIPDHDVGVVVLANQTDNGVSASVVGRLLELLVPARVPCHQLSTEKLRSLAGTYRMVDFVDPELWYLAPLASVSVRPHRDSLAVRSWVTGETILVPEGPRRFRFQGSAADGASVYFGGDTMQAGFVRAVRMPWWRSLIARVAAGILLLGILLGRSVQRWRARRAARPIARGASGERLRAPGPGPWETLTLGPLALRDPLRLTEVLTERYGGVVRIPAPARPFVLVTEPAEVERVLLRQRERFAKNRDFIDLTSLLLGGSLLTTEGDEWLQHRRHLRELFRGSMLRRFDEIAIATTYEMVDRWCLHPGRIDVERETNCLALQIIGSWLGGTDLRGHADGIKRSLDTCQAYFLRRLGAAIVFRRSVPRTQGSWRVRRAIRKVRVITSGVIEQRRHDPGRDDVLSFLLRSSEDLTDIELCDHMITMLVAGHETSGIALAWMLDLLARHPEVVSRLRQEADQALGDRTLEPADLKRLPYAEQVAREVIRLYPSLPLIGRDVRETVVVGGVRVPAGGTLIISSWAMQRRADLWPEPERFDPTRFAEGLPTGARRFAYVPFGAGPRMCVGAQMTIHQLAIAATLVARRLELSPDGPRPYARVRATLQPSHPIWISVRSREPGSDPTGGSTRYSENAQPMTVPPAPRASNSRQE